MTKAYFKTKQVGGGGVGQEGGRGKEEVEGFW